MMMGNGHAKRKGHVLITGGAGFIGSHLADVMLDKGFEVTAFDCLLPQIHANVEKDSEGWPTYLSPYVRRIKGNVLDADAFRAALHGVSHLVHLAASVGVGQSMTNIVDYTRNNTLAAATILEVLATANHSVRRIAVASSMSIYGEGEYEPLEGAENDRLVRSREQLQTRQWDLQHDGRKRRPIPTMESKRLEPASIYAINKRDHEEMFLCVGRAIGIPTVALRLFNAYGARQALGNPYTGVAAIFISRLLNEQPPIIFEDGEQMRDFVHVRDVAEAFATVLQSDRQVWDVYNVGSGEPVTIANVARTLARVLSKNVAPEITNRHRVGDIRHCFADIGKFQRDFGFHPEYSFETGMRELVEWVARGPKPVDRSLRSMTELVSNGLVI